MSAICPVPPTRVDVPRARAIEALDVLTSARSRALSQLAGEHGGHEVEGYALAAARCASTLLDVASGLPRGAPLAGDLFAMVRGL